MDNDLQTLLDLIPEDRKPEVKNSDVWICCPDHKDGQERTQSMRIKSSPFGEFFCFGCGIKGSIKELGQLLEFDTRHFADNMAVQKIGRDIDQALLGEDDDGRSIDVEKMEFVLPWDASRNWRGISGKLLSKLDSELVVTEQGFERMRLNVKVHNKKVGNISCAMSANSKLKYINSPGPWIKRFLFCYDYALKLRNFRSHKILFLVEGPRDALNLLQYGIPTVSILGGKTVWSKHKAELVLEAEPKLVVLAFDPDEVGRAVTQLAYDAIGKYAKVSKLKLGMTIIDGKKEKEDPGNLSIQRIKRIKSKLFT